MRILFLSVLFLFILSVAAGGIWMYSCRSYLNNTYVTGEFLIEKGMSSRGVYNLVLTDEQPAGLYLYLDRVEGFAGKLRYGYYIADDISLKELLNDISSGRETLYKVTIPEGYNMYEVAARLSGAGIASGQELIEAFTDGELILELTGESYLSLEGFLAPGTYFFAKNYPAFKVAAKMVKEFYRTLPVDFEAKALLQGLSFYDALILASIVQKETYDEGEAPLVASVFLNRMKVKMPLQADPTIIYGIYEEYDGKIRKADLQNSTNLYNTYKHKGLTPTPISNPSVMALNAVIEPADSDMFYFVATKDGKHVFAENYDEHRRNVRIHQLGYAQ